MSDFGRNFIHLALCLCLVGVMMLGSAVLVRWLSALDMEERQKGYCQPCPTPGPVASPSEVR